MYRKKDRALCIEKGLTDAEVVLEVVMTATGPGPGLTDMEFMLDSRLTQIRTGVRIGHR
jgi:hypothetical protein